MFAKPHAKLGYFRWHSQIIFCACHAADFLNAFVSLWLMQKYIDPSKFGAVSMFAHYTANQGNNTFNSPILK